MWDVKGGAGFAPLRWTVKLPGCDWIARNVGTKQQLA
jgi:hypothetical protein